MPRWERASNTAAVRRQYAQALIDDDKPAFALQLFRGILTDPDLPGPEQIEARGGIGRCHKQLFVRTRDTARRAAHLADALHAYRSAYLEDDRRFWHGINTVALLLRAAREDPDTRDAMRSEATELAERVFTTVDQAEPATAWTRAIACEALIALGRFDEAVQRAEAWSRPPTPGRSRWPPSCASSSRCGNSAPPNLPANTCCRCCAPHCSNATAAACTCRPGTFARPGLRL